MNTKDLHPQNNVCSQQRLTRKEKTNIQNMMNVMEISGIDYERSTPTVKGMTKGLGLMSDASGDGFQGLALILSLSTTPIHYSRTNR